MKKMLLNIFIVLFLLIIVGCGKKMTAREAVSDYLDLYKSNDTEVMKQLDEFVEKEYLDEEQKDIYVEAMKREYASMMYEITQEKYESEYAYVTVKLTVIDLYKAQKDAIEYLDNNQDKFLDENGSYDKDKFTTYKLNEMKNASETITYEIVFKLLKDGNSWEVIQLSNDDLEKIHGIYNYNQE